MIKIQNQKSRSNKESCCGCGACAAVCPNNCIEMKEDEEGFLYPEVNAERCVQCERCTRSCPCEKSNQDQGYSKNGLKKQFPLAYGGWHTDEAILGQSSSGGAFSLFAERIIEMGGVVYGCAVNQKAEVFHQGVRSKEELQRLRKSKYVQSTLGNVFKEIEEALKKGSLVLFAGTPCECEAIYGYLARPYDNLYLCDFICHGVPSPKVFRDWVGFLEDKYHDTFQNISFRIKDAGWHSSGLQSGTRTFFAKRTRTHIPAFFDKFMNGFLENIYLRPSCHECRFKGERIHTDITIADFWGIKKLDKTMSHRKGTSLVLINSEKGKRLFDMSCASFHCRQYEPEKALRYNVSYFRSAPEHPERAAFFEDYFQRGIAYAMKKYTQPWHWVLYMLLYRKGRLSSAKGSGRNGKQKI